MAPRSLERVLFRLCLLIIVLTTNVDCSQISPHRVEEVFRKWAKVCFEMRDCSQCAELFSEEAHRLQFDLFSSTMNQTIHMDSSSSTENEDDVIDSVQHFIYRACEALKKKEKSDSARTVLQLTAGGSSGDEGIFQASLYYTPDLRRLLQQQNPQKQKALVNQWASLRHITQEKDDDRVELLEDQPVENREVDKIRRSAEDYVKRTKQKLKEYFSHEKKDWWPLCTKKVAIHMRLDRKGKIQSLDQMDLAAPHQNSPSLCCGPHCDGKYLSSSSSAALQKIPNIVQMFWVPFISGECSEALNVLSESFEGVFSSLGLDSFFSRAKVWMNSIGTTQSNVDELHNDEHMNSWYGSSGRTFEDRDSLFTSCEQNRREKQMGSQRAKLQVGSTYLDAYGSRGAIFAALYHEEQAETTSTPDVSVAEEKGKIENEKKMMDDAVNVIINLVRTTEMEASEIIDRVVDMANEEVAPFLEMLARQSSQTKLNFEELAKNVTEIVLRDGVIASHILHNITLDFEADVHEMKNSTDEKFMNLMHQIEETIHNNPTHEMMEEVKRNVTRGIHDMQQVYHHLKQCLQRYEKKVHELIQDFKENVRKDAENLPLWDTLLNSTDVSAFMSTVVPPRQLSSSSPLRSLKGVEETEKKERSNFLSLFVLSKSEDKLTQLRTFDCQPMDVPFLDARLMGWTISDSSYYMISALTMLFIILPLFACVECINRIVKARKLSKSTSTAGEYVDVCLHSPVTAGDHYYPLIE